MCHNELIFLHHNHFPRCRAVVDKRFDGYYTLQYMTQGSLFLVYDNREYTLAQPYFWPAYPGPHIRFHSFDRTSWWEHRYVAFKGKLAEEWFEAGLLPSSPVSAEEDQSYTALFDTLLNGLAAAGKWAHARAVNRFEQLLLDIAQQGDAPRHRPQWQEKALSFIREHSAETINYFALAHDLGMSLSTFRRKFNEATGIPVHTYVIEQRIRRARNFLANTDMPIKTIAEMLGYENVQFFTRQFKALTRTTPNAYRKSRLV